MKRNSFQCSNLIGFLSVVFSFSFPLIAQSQDSSTTQEMLSLNQSGLPKIWLHSASEPPAMKLIFADDGTFVFQGGFLFWSPGKWNYDATSKQLTLILPKMSKRALASTIIHAKRDQIISYNHKFKSITYQLQSSANALQITFQGRVFFPESSPKQ